MRSSWNKPSTKFIDILNTIYPYNLFPFLNIYAAFEPIVQIKFKLYFIDPSS